MGEADTLRRAAKVLREAARNATQGPWVITSEANRYGGIAAPDAPADEEERAGYGGKLIGESMTLANRVYVGLVEPAVGASLADWLDAEAEAYEWHLTEGDTGDDLAEPFKHALAVARALLREEGGDV